MHPRLGRTAVAPLPILSLVIIIIYLREYHIERLPRTSLFDKPIHLPVAAQLEDGACRAHRLSKQTNFGDRHQIISRQNKRISRRHFQPWRYQTSYASMSHHQPHKIQVPRRPRALGFRRRPHPVLLRPRSTQEPRAPPTINRQYYRSSAIPRSQTLRFVNRGRQL